jgi:hypothetical protein
MAGIFDYLFWRGDLSLRQSPFNAVDNIILTHLSYLPFDGIVPGPAQSPPRVLSGPVQPSLKISIAGAAEKFAAVLKKKPGAFDALLISKEDPELLAAAGESVRYRNMELAGYVNQIDLSEEKQFAALVILTGDGSSFITYRGTDTSLVGWKEDFNMSFSAEVPAQREAVRYLEAMAKQFRGPLRLGGHSKGGNLAVYAASFCSKKVRNRITEIYSNDAPGFNEAVISNEGYKSIRERVRAFVPQTSVIGMLFEHDENYTVVKSARSGIMQHDVFSWEVTCNDLVRLSTVTRESRFIDRTMRDWLGSLDKEQRQRFIEALFEILSSSEARSLPEFTADWLKHTRLLLQGLNTIDEPTRKLIAQALAALFQAAKNNIHTLLPQAGRGRLLGPLLPPGKEPPR